MGSVRRPAIEVLPPAEGATEPEPFAGPDHPMRVVTREMAFGGRWTSDHATFVRDAFNGLAPLWSEAHVNPIKRASIQDAFHRVDLPTAGRWLELGSGTGAGTQVLAGIVDEVIAFDISSGMLAEAPSDLAPRIRGDASSLPFAANSMDAVLMVNMILFPYEVDRVLRPDGAVLWVNTLGDQTPIHLPPGDVAEALPGDWAGSTARAGTGFWAALTRE